MPKKGKQYAREGHKEGMSLIITSEHMLHVLKEPLKTALQKEYLSSRTGILQMSEQFLTTSLNIQFYFTV
jgi:hypothetical protein